MWPFKINLESLLRFLGIMALLGISIFVFITLNDLFFGVLLAFLVDHFVELLEESGVNKYLAIGMIVFIMALTIFLLLFDLIPLVVRNTLEVITTITNKINNPVQNDGENFFWLEKFYGGEVLGTKSLLKNVIIFMQKNFLPSNNDDYYISGISMFWQKGDIFAKQFSSAITTLLGFSCTIFISREITDFITHSHSYKKVKAFLMELRKEIRLFLFYQFLIGIFNLLFFYFVLSFFGVKGRFSIALSSFIGSFITSFGSTIGIIIALITVIIQKYHWHSILIILFSLLFPFVMENYVFIPRLVCSPLKVSYLAVLISILGVLKLFGAKYILFAVPLLLIYKKLILQIINIKKSNINK